MNPLHGEKAVRLHDPEENQQIWHQIRVAFTPGLFFDDLFHTDLHFSFGSLCVDAVLV